MIDTRVYNPRIGNSTPSIKYSILCLPPPPPSSFVLFQYRSARRQPIFVLELANPPDRHFESLISI